MNVVPPDAGTVDTSIGQPGLLRAVVERQRVDLVPQIVAVPIAPATNSVREAASMTGMLSMPMG